MISSYFILFFSLFAWPMTPPKPYGPFHLCLTAAGSFIAWKLARSLARRTVSRPGTNLAVSCTAADSRFAKKPARPGCTPLPAAAKAPRRLLFHCGLLLFFLEAFKQGFLFFIENKLRFSWWYFPFQLCSVPMYLCLLLPFVRTERTFGVLCSFLQDFSLLGGIMALAVPPGLMHPYVVMTLHGFVWHFILLFIGIYCAALPPACTSLRLLWREYARTLPILFFCSALALLINIFAGPEADMFYISPYFPSSQPIFHNLSLALGIIPGIFLYVLAMAAAGFLVHIAAARLRAKS